MTDKQSTTPQTVGFNVGGKLVETSRSLIDEHLDTMLARLVSDTWQEDPTKSVFIDRDGDIFAQVLNYLRYGSIVLPDKIVKEMFLRDMDYYGIIPAEGTVQTSSEAWAKQVKDRVKKIDELESEASLLKMENDIQLLANHCASRYMFGVSANHITDRDVIVRVITLKPGEEVDDKLTKERLWDAAVCLNCSCKGAKDSFAKSLSMFGLRMTKPVAKRNPNCIAIMINVL